MSANNVVWVMRYNGLWNVFYSGCFDNTPKEPDYEDKYYAEFKTRTQALNYANTVVWAINKECSEIGHVGVEYGVCIVPQEFTKPKLGLVKPWARSGLATILEYVDGVFRIRRYGWEAILPRNHIDCMERSIDGIYAFSLKEGREVEWVKMKSMVDHLEIEDTIAHILPTLDALYIASKTVTNKDIQDFVKLVENMVGDLHQELITKENRIKERLCILERKFICKADHYDMDKIADHVTKGDHKEIYPEQFESYTILDEDDEKRILQCNKKREPLIMPEALKAIMKDDVRRYIKNTYIDGYNDGIKREKALNLPKQRDDGCYQFTYCNECLAYPMGLDCPNLTKGPVQLKVKLCNECDSYGQCDHQGAYKTKDGKWCYE